MTQLINDPQFGMGQGQKNDPPLSPSSPYIHGTNGLFNIPGTDPRVFSAMQLPITGLINALPVYSGMVGLETDMYGAENATLQTYVTGVTSGDLDTPSNQPTSDCADYPVGGLMKAGTVVNEYANYGMSTREVSMWAVSKLQNRIEPRALQLMNSPTNPGGILGMAGMPALPNTLMNELANRIYESAVSFIRMFSKQIWIGDPSTNSGKRRQVWGLESQINTGTHKDYKSSAVLTAVDPQVFAFGFDMVDSTSPTARNIMEYLEMADAYAMRNAQVTGLDPYEYALVMNTELFREITAIVPVKNYFEALNQMAAYNNGRVMVDARDALALRNEFRSMKILPLNGRNVPVILDDSIPYDTVQTAAQLQAGQYASDIYAIPMSILGGIPATYWRYVDRNNGNEQSIAQFAGQFTWTTDGGLWRWYADFSKGCLKLNAEMQPKLCCIAPQVAYRITDVGYQPLRKFSSAYPSETNYFVNGGNTTQVTTQNLYVGWSSSPQSL